MGVNYGQRRQRNADLKNPGEIVTAAIGEHDFKMNHYDEQQTFDLINKKLDIQEAKLKRKSEFFER